MRKCALVSGITGQDGSYLAELLLEKGYEVHGIIRRSSLEPKNLARIQHIADRLRLHEGDLLDQSSLIRLMDQVDPTEVYNLAAQSHVGTSFLEPEHTANVTGLGVIRMLEACATLAPAPRFYQAGSSEMFGDVAEEPQTEKTELRARSPYGAAKILGYHMCKVYREAYGMHANVGILFNHESPRRGLNFVTRKITDHVARQVLGLTDKPLELGNLDAKRDWGFAGDYVEAMWRMLQREEPGDFVIATGETHTVREFVEAAYAASGVDTVVWGGAAETEAGWVPGIRPEPAIKVNPRFYRPADVQTLTGDPTKARVVLGWEPKTKFEDLVRMMVQADMEALKPRTGDCGEPCCVDR